MAWQMASTWTAKPKPQAIEKRNKMVFMGISGEDLAVRPEGFRFNRPFFPHDCPVFILIIPHIKPGFQKLRGARSPAMAYAAKERMRCAL